MILIEPAPYLPFMEARTARPPGLLPLDPAEWIPLDADFAPQMARRQELIAERPDEVLAMSGGGEAPARELLAELLAYLATRPGWTCHADGRVTRPDGVTVTPDPEAPMASAGRLLADDLCLLVPDEASGEYRLVAAVLCFPSRWVLAEKIGRPLTAIHDPVPDYDEMLARRVNRVFEALRVGRPVWRANWLVHPSPELFAPVAKKDKTAVPPTEGPFYLRTERQTLLRLPGTGAVVFGIKSSVTPVAALAPVEAARLAEAMAGLDPDSIAYRLGPETAAAAVASLREIAGQGAGAAAS